MLDIVGKSYRNCDGVSRRSMLRVGSLALGGITLADHLRIERAQAAAGQPVKKTAVIQIFMGGGPSHIDMYDLKPQAPAEYRGEFREIATNLPGVRFGELLPLQAQVMDKLAIVRSVSHTEPSHLPASHWLLTGYPVPSVPTDNVNPSTATVAAKQRGANVPGMPACVAVPRKTAFGSPAYLGASFSPFMTEKDPSAPDYKVRNLELAKGLSIEQFHDRRALLGQLDRLRRQVDEPLDLGGMEDYYRDAMEMVSGARAARAFDLTREPASLRDRYGRTTIGQGCLLARRLVEAGVTYVTVLSGGGWDTHANNFKELRDISLPRYDRAVAALVADLHARGLNDRVLVMATGEFGRTPKINKDAGRDHWPHAMCVLFAGGGLRVGQVVGATDSRAAYPITRPYSLGSVLSTMYHVLGIDTSHMYYDQQNRPLPILPEGEPIPELIG